VSIMEFTDTDIPDDVVPPTTDVEYPCEICGKESGPYGGRGRKPKRCPEHKKGTSVRKLTGNAGNLAVQASETLSQLNGIIAIGLMAVGFNRTASTIAAGNDVFTERAHAALLTDPDLCKLILKGGVKSAKISLGIAYGGLLMPVIPVAMDELRERREEALARKNEQEG
jgi:hypothetical protein